MTVLGTVIENHIKELDLTGMKFSLDAQFWLVSLDILQLNTAE